LISIADDELDERKAESELARFPTVINTPFWFGKVGKELEIPFGLSCLSSFYMENKINTVVSNHVNSDHVPSFSCLDV
jgi:hypothetical protein